MLQPMQHLSLFSRTCARGALRAEGLRGRHASTPCYKTLSVDYLINQIKPLNPLLSANARALSRALVPASVLRKNRRINIGEILAVGGAPVNAMPRISADAQACSRSSGSGPGRAPLSDSAARLS